MLLRCILLSSAGGSSLPVLKSSKILPTGGGVDKLCQGFGVSAVAGKSYHHDHGHHHHHQRRFVINSQELGGILRPGRVALVFSPGTEAPRRGISLGRWLSEESKAKMPEGDEDAEAVPTEAEEEGSEGKAEGFDKGRGGKRDITPVGRHLSKDRTKEIPVEASMRYLNSAAYKETYGENPIWFHYRRNFPGQFAPKETRKMCIRNGEITTGNPCPLCRDEYLVVDYRNVELLKQFISPHNGEVLGWEKTGVCRKKHWKLLIEIERAKDYGLVTFDVPFREYDYDEYQAMYNTNSQTSK